MHKMRVCIVYPNVLVAHGHASCTSMTIATLALLGKAGKALSRRCEVMLKYPLKNHALIISISRYFSEPLIVAQRHLKIWRILQCKFLS